jgi:DNA primase
MAGRIPQSFINDLLARVDIVDVIDARMTLRKAGASRYKGLCPFHDEKTPSFSVDVDKQFYYCFGCQVSGTALTFLMEHDRLEFPEAVETLAASIGVEVPRETLAGGAAPKEDKRLYEVLAEADRHFRAMLRGHDDAPRAVEYLKSRGLTGVVARDFGIGFAPPGWDGLLKAAAASEVELERAGLVVKNEQNRVYDRFRDRITFPIHDTRGRVIGFGGRVLGDDTPKYLNSPETPVFHKGRELYGLYEARRAVRHLKLFVVVEGYMDVVALAQAGIPYAVASLGTATSETHFDKLFRYAPEVICCFDGDRAGRDAAWKALGVALPTLKQGRQLKFMFVPDGDDPDTLVRKEGKDAFAERLNGALSAPEYLFQHLALGLDLTAMDDRARLAELAIPLVATVPDGVLRELMMNRLAELAQLPVDALYRGAPTVGRAPVGRTPKAVAAKQSRISEHLLALLLQHPEFLRTLAPSRRDRLLDMADSLVARVVKSALAQPEADTTVLLGYWSGDVNHALLVQLADRPTMLEGEALQTEFVGAVDQVIANFAKSQRRALVTGLQEDASKDKLEAYWETRQQHPQGDSTKR